MPDRIEETLGALRVDVDRTPLADSGSVRRRGDRRTRNQVVGSALAVLAVVAGVAGLTGGLVGGDRAIAPPATDRPSVSITPERVLALLGEPFLQSEDFTGLGAYGELGPVRNSGVEPEIFAEACQVRPAEWGAAETKATQFYQDGSEMSARQYVLRYGTAAEAEHDALKRAYDDLTGPTCPTDPTDGTLDVRDPVGIPTDPEGLRMSRYFVPSFASEPNYHEVAVVREANVVIVLEWTSSGHPEEFVRPGGWVWNADILAAALDRATG